MGFKDLLICLDDLVAKVMTNAIRNATHAVLNTSDTRTARIDFHM